MILAAGKGTRLRPLTDAIPKPLIDVAGEPMIAFPLRLLRAAGIEEVVINLHHLGDQIRRTLGDGRAYGVRITYSEENPILDTGGAIAAVRRFLEHDTFVVLTQDEKPWRTYFDVSDDQVPYVVVIDATGRVLWRGHGSAADLEPKLKEALKADAVSRSSQ